MIFLLIIGIGEFMKDNFGCVKTFTTLCLVHKKYKRQELTKLIGVDLQLPPVFDKRMNMNAFMLSSCKEVNSNNLTDHIQFNIEKYLEIIQKLNDFSQIRLYAYWESLHGNGGPYLEKKQMQILGNAKINLFLNFY